MLDADMAHHVPPPEDVAAGNTRNGHHHKTVLTGTRVMPLDVPRDRRGTFEPQRIEPYARRLPGFDHKVIHRFAHGMTTRPMQRRLRELSGIEVAPALIATSADAVVATGERWRQRPLAPGYPIV